jgi:hypothetical protein
MTTAFKAHQGHPVFTDLICLRVDVGGKIKENERQAAELPIVVGGYVLYIFYLWKSDQLHYLYVAGDRRQDDNRDDGA